MYALTSKKTKEMLANISLSNEFFPDMMPKAKSMKQININSKYAKL